VQPACARGCCRGAQAHTCAWGSFLLRSLTTSRCVLLHSHSTIEEGKKTDHGVHESRRFCKALCCLRCMPVALKPAMRTVKMSS